MIANTRTKTPKADSDEWQSPPCTFAYMAKRFPFDVDLAANEQNTLCRRWLGRHGMFWVDSLEAEWRERGQVGWCNPPYSHIDPWLRKARYEAAYGFTTVFLIPSDNGEDRYGVHVHDIATEYISITGRLAYLRPDGRPVAGNNRGSCFVIYRAYDLGNTRYSNVRRTVMEKLYGEAA
jgi:phage N-6-adenine-methyltransferase